MFSKVSLGFLQGLVAAVLLCGIGPRKNMRVDAFAPTTAITSHRPARTGTALYYQDETLPSSSTTSHSSASEYDRVKNVAAEQQRQQWVHNSLQYYSKVMREERRRNLGQVTLEEANDPEYQAEFSTLAKKHYFALRKIKDGKPTHAETIYRRIISEILQHAQEGEDCDHAQLAITTLLLALHLQRTGAPSQRTRSVFVNFVRVAVVEGGEDECACSAKVLQAFALFEMKQGNQLKSLQLVHKAVQLDRTLQPVLKWKQFRDAHARLQSRRRHGGGAATVHP